MSSSPSRHDGTGLDLEGELSALLRRLKEKDGRPYRELESVAFWGKSGLQRRVAGTTKLNRVDLIRLLDIFGAGPDERAHALSLLELIVHNRIQTSCVVDQNLGLQGDGDHQMDPSADGADTLPMVHAVHGSIREPMPRCQSTWATCPRWARTSICVAAVAGILGIGSVIYSDFERQRQ